MSRYRRSHTPGATFFFTVTLADRRSSAAVMGRSASKRAKREKGIWQRRFWEHRIRDEIDLQRHIDYIHFNPVKHGLVGRVVDWPYSSFHRYVRQGWLAQDWGGATKDGSGFGEPE